MLSETGGAPNQPNESKSQGHGKKIEEEDSNSSNEALENSMTEENEQAVPVEEITFLSLIKNPQYLLSSMAGCVSQFVYSYLEPILAKRLEDLTLTQV